MMDQLHHPHRQGLFVVEPHVGNSERQLADMIGVFVDTF